MSNGECKVSLPEIETTPFLSEMFTDVRVINCLSRSFSFFYQCLSSSCHNKIAYLYQEGREREMRDASGANTKKSHCVRYQCKDTFFQFSELSSIFANSQKARGFVSRLPEMKNRNV